MSKEKPHIHANLTHELKRGTPHRIKNIITKLEILIREFTIEDEKMPSPLEIKQNIIELLEHYYKCLKGLENYVVFSSIYD